VTESTAPIADKVGELQRRLARSQRHRVRVLVVGPVTEAGGLARVARMTTGGFDTRKFDIDVCDTSRDTQPGRSLFTAIASHARKFRRLIAALRNHQPDVVHIHTCSFGTFHRSILDALACRVSRRPYVLHIHGGLFAQYLESLDGLRRAIVFAVLRRAERIVVLGETWRTSLTRLSGGLRISVVPNAIELSQATSSQANEALPGDIANPANRGAGIVFVGDLGETKRPEDLLIAYAALPRPLRQTFPLTLIGSGEPARHALLEKLAQRLGIAEHVAFTGSMAHQDVCERLARADLFVLPSKAEGLPLALLEAMAAGTPVVATRVGAIAEVARDKQEALLVDPQDTHALTCAMKRLLLDDNERKSLSIAARQRVQNDFPPQAFRQAIASIWQECAVAKKPKRQEVPRLAAPSFRSFLW